MTSVLRLCQYQDGPPIELRRPPHQARNPIISSWQLEDVLKSYLLSTSVDENSVDDDHDAQTAGKTTSAVEIVLRTDPNLLDASRPSVPLETITGVWEDTLSNPNLVMDVWEGAAVPVSVPPTDDDDDDDECIAAAHDGSNRTNHLNGSSKPRAMHTTDCKCPQVHSEWRRKPATSTRNVLSSSSSSLQEDDDDSVVVKWVDLRMAAEAANSNQLPLSLHTYAACCHFLRSLLGTSHASLLWQQSCSCDNNTPKVLPTVLPPIVALVMPSQASNVLRDFRTGDACPSYFLHSVSQLQLSANADASAWWRQMQQTPNTTTTAPTAPLQDVTLLIYKTMPPRDRFSIEYSLESSASSNPNNKEQIPDGCLWERYYKHDDEDDDNEMKDSPPNQVEHEDEEEAYRMVCPPYISHTHDYPGLLEPLLEHLDTLKEEAMSIPKWTAWPERQHYKSTSVAATDGDDDDDSTACWTVFPLCHCFPANVKENRKWIDVTCGHVPRTVALLKETLGGTLRTALFSRLDPETTLEAHTGWQDLANHVIRVHIPLVVPPGGLCGTWVDGCVETHQEGRPLCFDDAKVHRAFNYSNQERVVLILDLARPKCLPPGYATGGHTEELDSFIAQLT